MTKVRLDTLLAQRGLFGSRARAAASVMAGEVRLGGTGGERAAKPGQLVAEDVEVAVDERPRFVSRGGIKLANALDAPGRRRRRAPRLDVGASTGGFTDCLLQRGAAHVVALDVAYGELDWALRTDERVTVLERTNARALTPDDLPYAPDLVVADVSFISLTKVLPAVLALLRAERFDALAMVKPQFEVGRGRVGKGGVVRDPARRREALVAVARPPRERGRRGARLRVLGPARARRATARRSCGWPRPGAPAPSSRPRGRGAARSSRDRPQRARPPSSPTRRPAQTAAALRAAHRGAPSARASLLRFDAEETRKHGLDAARRASCSTRRSATTSTSASSLGGDGTILRALRRYAGTSVPVFAVNFGEVGFLATIDPDEDGDRRLRARVRGRLRDADAAGDRAGDRRTGPQAAINDVSIHRKRRRARRRARLRARRRGGRPRALRRARRRHAGRARRATTSPTAAR